MALNENEKLSQIINLGLEVSQFKDLDVVMERILTLARRYANAEAGSIYIREGHRLKFSYTQNDLLQAKLPPDRKLIFSAFSIPINNNSISGYVACTGSSLNIADVYELPSNTPYSFDKGYDVISNYRTKSVLTLPLKACRDKVIGVLQLINAVDESGCIKPFDDADIPLIMHFAASAAITLERAQMTRAIILRLVKMAELRDPKETGAHVNRVAAYAVEIYEAWALTQGIEPKEIERNKDILRIGAMLHDIGKIAIVDAILKKPARLTPEEYEVMKHHTYLGARLFSDIYSEFDEAANDIALNHHERWDGKGYPGHIDTTTALPLPGYKIGQGKRGEEIPVFGRIVAIADVYDALSSKRAYKEPWDENKVLETLREDSNKCFDPDMINAFFARLDVIRNISDKYPD
jgi:HD-GYP domain-containing protein (c-di-GMP phosphodiesterase class II)